MIEQIGTDQGIETAMVEAANIIANAIKLTDLHSGNIEMEDVWWTATPLVGGGVKQAELKLKTGTLKNVVCSFGTVVPLRKLCAAD